MELTHGLRYEYIDGWCAGIKVSNVNANSIPLPENTIENIMARVWELDGTVVLISVAEYEAAVIQWLKDNKFRNIPWVFNRNSGRKTALFYKVIPKSLMKKWEKEQNND